MAEGLNRVTLIGNLGQEPELRVTQGGQAILNLRIATTESFVNRDRERQERTEWHTVVMWGKRGEALSKFLSKGSRICVEGRLQTRSWEAQDGGRRYTTEVVATNILLLGTRAGGGGGARDEGAPPPSDRYQPAGTRDDAFDDDDIPF